MGRSLVTSTALPPIDGRRLATTMTLMLATTDDGDDDLHCMPIIYSHRPCRHSTHSHHTHTQHIGIGFASLSIPLCHFARSAVGEYYMILCVVCCSVVYLVVRFGPKLNFKGSGRIPSSVFGHIYIYIYIFSSSLLLTLVFLQRQIGTHCCGYGFSYIRQRLCRR